MSAAQPFIFRTPPATHKEDTPAMERERDPLAAPPPGVNIWKQPRYKPETFGTPRPGCNDHLACKSRGDLT